MLVFRVECGACSIGHGTMVCSLHCSPAMNNHLNYGGALEPPDMDPMLGTIYDYEVCGTLQSQFNLWWKREEYNWIQEVYETVEAELHFPWILKVYSAPESAVRVGNHQVCFDKSKAKVLAQFDRVPAFLK